MTFQETHRLQSTEYPDHLEPRAHDAIKIACVARDGCARCGVLFRHSVAYKGIAIACKQNSIGVHQVEEEEED